MRRGSGTQPPMSGASAEITVEDAAALEQQAAAPAPCGPA